MWPLLGGSCPPFPLSSSLSFVVLSLPFGLNEAIPRKLSQTVKGQRGTGWERHSPRSFGHQWPRKFQEGPPVSGLYSSIHCWLLAFPMWAPQLCGVASLLSWPLPLSPLGLSLALVLSHSVSQISCQCSLTPGKARSSYLLNSLEVPAALAMS